MPDVWYQVRKKVGDMPNTLPQGVIGPVFNDDFGDVYGTIYALSADGFSREELRDFADGVRRQLLMLPDVAKALALGMTGTRYVEPTGLSSDNRASAHELLGSVSPADTLSEFRVAVDRPGRFASW